MPHYPLSRRTLLASACCGAAALTRPWAFSAAAQPAGGEVPCAELHLPPELQAEADKLAQQEDRGNVPLQLPVGGPMPLTDKPQTASTVSKLAAVIKAKKWANGRTIRVAFLGGPLAIIQKRVEQAALEWTKYANIKFLFGVPAAQSDVRIAFGNTGHWSNMGTDVLAIPKARPTMNLQLGLSDPLTEYSRVVIHEFGHTLGLIHEHQHPDGGIPWDKPKAFAYYKQTQDWTDQMVQSNLFDTYNRSWLQYGMYDPKSIMHYPIPAQLLTDATKAVGWNTVLSPLDKVYVRAMYPA